MAQIATLALMIGGEGVFRLFGAPTPNWYGGFKENKMFAFGCVWMANNVAAGMVATGAFEIVVGDHTIYSKLETKKHLVGTRIKVMGQVVHDDAPFNEWVEKWF